MNVKVSCPKNHVPTYFEEGLRFQGPWDEIAYRIATHVAIPCPHCGDCEVSIEDNGRILGHSRKWVH